MTNSPPSYPLRYLLEHIAGESAAPLPDFGEAAQAESELVDELFGADDAVDETPPPEAALPEWPEPDDIW